VYFSTQISNLIEQNKYYKARNLLNKNQEFKDDPAIILLKIESLQGKNPSMLLNLLEQLLKKDQSPWTLYQILKFYYDQKNIKKIQKIVKKIFPSAKESAMDYCAFGYTYLTQGNKAKAKEEFEQAHERDKKLIKPMIGLVEVFSDPKDQNNKLEWVNKILEISPNNYIGLVSLLDICILNKEYNIALEQVDKIKKECKSSKFVLYCEGLCYYKQKEFKKARDTFFSARSGRFDEYNVDMCIGLTYLKENQYKKVNKV